MNPKIPRSSLLPAAQITRFLVHLADALAAEDTDPALAAIEHAVRELVGEVHVYFGYYRSDAPPIVLDAGRADAWNRMYPDGYYLLDPTYEAFLHLEASTCLLPQNVFPANFRESEFYLSYCRPARMVDEICFLLCLEPGLAAYVSVLRLGDTAPYRAAECRRLAAVLPAMDMAMRHVWKLSRSRLAASDAAAQALHTHLSAAYEHFGAGTLSEREAEVTRLLLKGLAPKLIGRLLDIAPGTVRNHIKSIYIKLEVRSQAELMACFFDALSAAPAAPP